MNLLKRSFLYLFRKWKVSILLLLILFMVVTLTLSGIAVLNAEIQKIEEYTKEQAIKELIKSRKLNEKISAILSYKSSL